MTATIQPRRGPESTIPTLAEGEVAITTDTHKLFVGTAGGNVEVVTSSPSSGLVRLGPVQTLGAPAASVTFSAIPAGYSALRLIAMGRISEVGTDDWINLQFNGDTAGNYDYDFYTAKDSTITGSSAQAASSAHVGDFPGTTGTANMPGIIVLDIPFYTNTTFYKQAIAQFFTSYATSATNQPLRTVGVQWRSTAAITSIVLTPQSGNFITGCEFALWGLV